MTARTVSIEEAAKVLSISPDAVRKRVKRGKLQATTVDGKIHVVLDDVSDKSKTTQDNGPQSNDLLIEALQQQVKFLQEQIEAQNAILRNQTQAIAALSAMSARLSLPQITEEVAATQDACVVDARPWWKRLLGRK